MSPTTNVMGSLWQLAFGGPSKDAFRWAKANGVDGNMKGEGFKMGGVWVLGPGAEGIQYEHREKSWGDNVFSDKDAFLAAVDSIKK
mmetsp:Transcript_23329/g.55523  ORF Transcript_23329/g.55523 Transcript_23329/m.55523 type:complete len:86 (+) Transcript_23329:459-716(+)|eukprot:975370-Rhodomonas_salina.1